MLTLAELSSSSVVDTKESHDAVNDEKAVFVADEELGNLIQELHLVLRVDGASVGDVVLSCILVIEVDQGRFKPLTCLWIDSEAFCDLSNPLRPECAFRVCTTPSVYII